MSGFAFRLTTLSTLSLVAVAGSLAACSDETSSTTTTTASTTSSSSTTSSTSGGGEGGAGGAGTGGAGGAGGTCTPVTVKTATINGMIMFTGTVGATDVLRIVAFENGMPGPPAGFISSPAGPTFPYTYELPITLPAAK